MISYIRASTKASFSPPCYSMAFSTQAPQYYGTQATSTVYTLRQPAVVFREVIALFMTEINQWPSRSSASPEFLPIYPNPPQDSPGAFSPGTISPARHDEGYVLVIHRGIVESSMADWDGTSDLSPELLYNL